MSPRHSFRMRLSLQVMGLILGWTLLLALLFSFVSIAVIQRDRGHLFENSAIQMAQVLDYEMYIHVKEIETLAANEGIQSATATVNDQRLLLDVLKQTSSDYAWIGLTNSQGQVIASSDRILEGLNVAERPWFIKGKQMISVQDVHSAKLLAELVPNPSPDGEPLRFVDIAAPVIDSSGVLSGVLATHLYWQWSDRIRGRLLQPLSQYQNVEMILISEAGEVLLAPSRSNLKQGYDEMALQAGPVLSQLVSYQNASQAETGYRLERWLKGSTYLTGYSQTTGRGDYQGLGWIVLVRQRAQDAFALIYRLQRLLLGVGILGAVSGGLVAWWFASQVSKPVLQLAQTVQDLDQANAMNRQISMPQFTHHDELALLSRVIATLVNHLAQRNQQLINFNGRLEAIVQHRTQELRTVNQQLIEEVEHRKQAQNDLETANQVLQRLAQIDALTQIANRRQFDHYLQSEWARALRQQVPISVLMIDVDWFKLYNDTYGHVAGDDCLQRLAASFAQTLSQTSDLVSRYGGEEFAVILPATSHLGALHCAEQIRAHVAALKLPHVGSPVKPIVSVSIGVATIVPKSMPVNPRFVLCADRCLYHAKAEGRDRVVGIDLGQDALEV